ncbi:hypothetical protein CRENBAI_023379 [Crenichthys baileyi]|uniref:Threonylcarbamoyl-AMP synthase n=1 Tax=Crenichthys baileyi TaxID=28760 RepID=A0AAV9RWJ8_9TELE
MGPPLIKEKMKSEISTEPPCPVASSRLSSGLLKIAGLLEEGGVCGIPTDTVYALAASCKNPQAIEKIYNIKGGAAYDRVGTRDSIMIRVPDHTVTCHLCDITGPPAISSQKNPLVNRQHPPQHGHQDRIPGGEDVPSPNPKMAFQAHVILRLHVFLQGPSAK